MSRYQIEKIHGHELTILDVPDNTEISVRKAVQLLSLYGGQGHIHYTVVVAAQLGNASVNGKIYCVIADVMHLCHVPTNEFHEICVS